MKKLLLISLGLLALHQTVKAAGINPHKTRAQVVAGKKAKGKQKKHSYMSTVELPQCFQCGDAFASRNELERHELKEGHVDLMSGRSRRVRIQSKKGLEHKNKNVRVRSVSAGTASSSATSISSLDQDDLIPELQEFLSNRASSAIIISPSDSRTASILSPITIDDIDYIGDQKELSNYMIVEQGEVESPSVEQLSEMQFVPIQTLQLPVYNHQIYQNITNLLKEDGNDDNTDKGDDEFLKYLEQEMKEEVKVMI